MGTDLPHDARLGAQLDRLRAALHPPGGSPPASAAVTELLALGTPPARFTAVRVTDTALARPWAGDRADWRLTIVALTGLDAGGMRFVPVPRRAECDLLDLLGLGVPRAGRSSVGCTSLHLLIRDENGVLRPRSRPGGAAAAR